MGGEGAGDLRSDKGGATKTLLFIAYSGFRATWTE